MAGSGLLPSNSCPQLTLRCQQVAEQQCQAFRVLSQSPVSESKHHRRRRRAGYVHLRRLASPADLGGGRPVRLVHTPAFLGLALTRLVGLLRDVVLSRDEVDGLMAGLLTSDSAPIGVSRPGDWICDNGDALGRRYVSEIRRNFRQRR